MTWIQTTSGVRYDLRTGPDRPLSAALDVVRPLSRLCRFTGHGRMPWSVAAHCVVGSVVAERCLGSRALARAFLLHEAGEALVGDVSSPLKGLLPGFRDLEALAHRHARAAFLWIGDPVDDTAEVAAGVRRLDVICLYAERGALFDDPPDAWVDPPDERDQWLVDRAEALVRQALYEGAGHGLRAETDFLDLFQDLNPQHDGGAK